MVRKTIICCIIIIYYSIVAMAGTYVGAINNNDVIIKFNNHTQDDGSAN